jgi:GNAT superfamily N-acetyltransferase
MASAEIHSIGEVDRSESVSALFRAAPLGMGLGLQLHAVSQDPPLRISRWNENDVRARVSEWGRELERGGAMLGAFRGSRLAGFAIVGPRRSDGSALLVALFVDRGERRSGIGQRLLREAEELARAGGARTLCIYSNPTASAVNFYLKSQARIIALADKSEVQALDLDVVLSKRL